MPAGAPVPMGTGHIGKPIAAFPIAAGAKPVAVTLVSPAAGFTNDVHCIRAGGGGDTP